MKPGHVRFISTLLAIIFALPFSFDWVIGLYNWLSPFILLNSLFLLKSLVVLNILGFVILILSFFRNRWFCRYLCPVGLGCDTVSTLSPRKSVFLKSIPSLSRWLYLISLVAAWLGIPLFILLDPMAIFNGFFSVFAEPFTWLVLVSMLGLPVLIGLHYFFPNLWCTRICPLGGLFDDLYFLKKLFLRKSEKDFKKISITIISRRFFLAGGAGVTAGLFIPRALASQNKNKFKPPASLPEPLFSTLCVRCGSCIKACPANILRHDTSNGGLSWMTPELIFHRGGYCHEDCNLCGTVCPSGSISPFSTEAKKQLFIATIEIGLDKCLLTNQKECDRCKAVCSYNAIEIVPTSTSLIMKPEVDFNQCVGCGACEVICPEETIIMKARS